MSIECIAVLKHRSSRGVSGKFDFLWEGGKAARGCGLIALLCVDDEDSSVFAGLATKIEARRRLL